MDRKGPLVARFGFGFAAAALVGVAVCGAPAKGEAAGARKGAPGTAAEAKSGEKPADRAYAAGLKAFEAGKAAQAVSNLSAAINGGLGAEHMARALMTRGLAHRKTGQSALAIADLSNALWLKTGLAPGEIAQAEEARTAAYAEAGLSAPSVQTRTAAASLAQAQPLAPRPVAPVPQARTAPAPAAPVVSGWQAATKSQAPAPGRSASAAESAPREPTRGQTAGGQQVWQPPVAQPPDWSAPVTTQAARPAAPPPAAPPAIVTKIQPAPPQAVVASRTPPVSPPPVQPPVFQRAPQAAAVAPRPEPQIPREVAALPSASTPRSPAVAAAEPPRTSVADTTAPAAKSGGIGGFFTNLFGDMSLGPPSPPPPRVAARVPSEAAWSDQTSIAPSGASQAIAAAPPPPVVSRAPAPRASAAAPAAAGMVAGGTGAKPAASGYRLFVATAKTRQEAIKIATKLKTQHRRAVAGQQIAIDPETVDGAKAGYAVKLGPFASANEPRNLCVKLRQSGFDCRLLTP